MCTPMSLGVSIPAPCSPRPSSPAAELMKAGGESRSGICCTPSDGHSPLLPITPASDKTMTAAAISSVSSLSPRHIRHATIKQRSHRRTSSDPLLLSDHQPSKLFLPPGVRSELMGAAQAGCEFDESVRPWHEDKLRVQRAIARRMDFEYRRNTPSPLSSVNASVNASRCGSPAPPLL